MTPRGATNVSAARLWAVLSASALVMAWAGDARAGCAGRAHTAGEPVAAVAILSAEILGDESPWPPKPPGCTGAFCGKTDGPAGMDFTGGVDLRADSWACAAALAALDHGGGARLISPSDELRPTTSRDELVDPPR
jgi:hypothetical protein